jgi:hypothetical protein
LKASRMILLPPSMSKVTARKIHRIGTIKVG